MFCGHLQDTCLVMVDAIKGCSVGKSQTTSTCKSLNFDQGFFLDHIIAWNCDRPGQTSTEGGKGQNSKRGERNTGCKGKRKRKVEKVTAALSSLWGKKWLQRRQRWSVFNDLRKRARAEIETGEQINKGNPFRPDTGLQADGTLLSGSIYLRHNAPVSSAHSTYTVPWIKDTVYKTWSSSFSTTAHTMLSLFALFLIIVAPTVLPLNISHAAHFLNRRENQVR